MREWQEEVERRLKSAKLDGAAEREIAEELSQHLQDRYDELRASGVAEPVAREQALAELGDAEALGDRVRRVRSAAPEPLPIGAASPREYLSGVLSDFRFGARMLARAPLYTVIAVVVIALGIAANTVIFTMVNALLLQPPRGVSEPEQLVEIFTSDYSGPRYGASSYPDFEQIRDHADIFTATTAYTANMFSMTGKGWTLRGMGEVVAPNYFEMLGVRPAAGRFFAPDGTDTEAVVISHEVWQTRFGGSRAAIGSSVTVKGQPLTIIGVTPREFGGAFRGLRMRLWLPSTAPVALTGLDTDQRGDRGLRIFGRMPAGATLEDVQSRLDVVAAALHAAYPELWTDVNDQSRVFTAVPEAQSRVPREARSQILGGVALLMSAVFLVLLVACTNVANLMLSRASVRRAEMGIRLALGATRARIMRHLLAESVLLALLGGATGVLLAVWFASTLRSVNLPLPVSIGIDADIDVRVLAFAISITLLTGLLFGLAPAIQASRAPAPMMRDNSRAGTRLRARHALVVFQVATSLVLLVAGGLFIRSLLAMQRRDSGFDTQNVVLARLDLGPEGYTDEQSARINNELLQRATSMPGTRAAALAQTVPLSTGYSRRSFLVAGYEAQQGEDMEFLYNGVTPGYFEVMGIPIRRGRAFTDADRQGAPLVAIVSEAFARRYWPGKDAIGQRVSMDHENFMEVVGVAADARYRSLTEDPQPYIYFSHMQYPAPHMTLLARTDADPALAIGALRDHVRATAPALPAPAIHTFAHHISLTALPQTIAAALLSALGIFAVGIAIIGLYGLVAFGVAQRGREFGIRMALGAATTDVRRLVMGQALRLIGIGVLCGAPIAVAVAFVMRSFLNIQPLDPVAFIGVPLLLAACAAIASYGPARRATQQHPAATLRAE
jgi:predicted permease